MHTLGSLAFEAIEHAKKQLSSAERALLALHGTERR